MTGRIPERPSDAEAEGVPDSGLTAPGQREAGDMEAVMEPPRDTAVAVDEFGTTAAEQREGESLTGRLDREVPDVIDRVQLPPEESAGADTPFDQRAGQGVGRLVEPDEGVRSDTESDMIATDVGTDLGGYSAEEAAMHVVPEV